MHLRHLYPDFPGIASFNGVQMEIAVRPSNLLRLGTHLGPTLVTVKTIEYLESLIELNSVCVRYYCFHF